MCQDIANVTLNRSMNKLIFLTCVVVVVTSGTTGITGRISNENLTTTQLICEYNTITHPMLYIALEKTFFTPHKITV